MHRRLWCISMRFSSEQHVKFNSFRIETDNQSWVYNSTTSGNLSQKFRFFCNPSLTSGCPRRSQTWMSSSVEMSRRAAQLSEWEVLGGRRCRQVEGRAATETSMVVLERKRGRWRDRQCIRQQQQPGPYFQIWGFSKREKADLASHQKGVAA